MIHTPDINSGIPVSIPSIVSGNISYTFSDPCLFTSIHENISRKFEFEVYPNPAAERIHISLTDFQRAKLNITDVAGKLIYSEVFDSQITVNSKYFQSGMYFITLIPENGISATKRIVIVND